jgi:hypothetical protein
MCLEGVGFRRFGEVTVKAHGIGDRLAPLATTGDVFGAVVPVGDDVNVQASAVVIATAANLCDRVGGAVKGAGYAVEQGAHGVPVKAGGVI